MSWIRKAWEALRGGPWVEVEGVQEGPITRFVYPDSIKIVGTQELDAVYEYRADGRRIHRMRIRPWIPMVWDRFRTWLAWKIAP